MLSPRWRKVTRDLWSNKTRTILVVLAIAVGVFAFGSVFITREVLLSDMDAQYRAVNASGITINIPSFDDSLVRWARHQEEVVDAQGRAVHLVKVLGEEKTFNLDLYAFDDYEDMRLNRISLEKGTWPPGRHEILFERTSIPLTGAGIGDTIVIELPNGQQRELKVAGTVHDLNVFPAGIFPQLSGYVSMRTLSWLDLPSTYNRLEIVARGEYSSLTKLEKLADELKNRLQRMGFSVKSVTVREPDEHWGRENSEAFIAILTGIGIFSLILSGFLVVNTITSLLAQQRRQIGMMKAVGGRGGQITGIYLVTVTFYGLLALLVAVPAGLGLAYLFTVAVMQFLNINILNFHLPLSVVLMQLITVLVVPIVASLIPVLGGVRVTVREAISDYGIGGKGGYGLFDRLLVQVRGLPRPVLLSLRNTFRARGRLFLTLGTLTLAGTLFISVVNVRGALMAEIDKEMEMFNYEVELSLDGSYHSRGIERRAKLLPGVTEAEGRASVPVQRVKPDGTKSATFPVIGLPPDSNFSKPTLLSGRWLQEKDRNAIVLSSDLVRNMPDVQVGDRIVLEIGYEEEEWEVVGIISLLSSVGFADFDYLSSIKGERGLASTLYVSTEPKDGPFQTEVAKALEKRFKDTGIKVNQWITKDTILQSNAGQFDFLVAFLMAMAFLAALIGGLGLTSTMSLNVLERTREIGVMRSIGAANAAVSGVVMTEGILVGLISWTLAVPLSIPVSMGFNAVLGQAFFDRPMEFLFSWAGLIIWLSIVLIISVVASLLPAYRAIRMSVRETLAYE